jgi:hypothetical protein
MGGDQDYPAAQPFREVEAVLVAEADVDEHDVRAELLLQSQRVGAGGGDPDDLDAFPLEQDARGVEEGSVVVDDEAADGQLRSARRRVDAARRSRQHTRRAAVAARQGEGCERQRADDE